MATTLYFRGETADTHLGTDNAGAAGFVGWVANALRTARGSALQTSSGSTVAGPTTGIEVGSPDEWISPPVAADVTISGTITANIWASESNMSANVAINVVIDIIRANATGTRDSNTIVQIARSTHTVEAAVTTRAAFNFTSGMTSGAYSAQTLQKGDRLRIRIFGDDSTANMGSGFTFNVGINGATAAADGDSFVTFTETFTFMPMPGTVNRAGSGGGEILGTGGTQEERAQSFQVAQASDLFAITLTLFKTLSPTDNLVITLHSDNAGVPGTLLTTIATVNAATYGGAANYTYEFTPVALAAATTYWIKLARSGARNATNYINWQPSGLSGAAPSNMYAAGVEATLNSGVWTAGTTDLCFVVHVGTPLYLTDTASDVATESVDREAWTSRGSGVVTDVTNTVAGWVAPIQVTDTAGGTVVDWFTPELAAFTLADVVVANLRALESNASANSSLRCEIARVDSDGTNPTIWGTWCIAQFGIERGEISTTEAVMFAFVSGDDLAFTDGQRIRIRVYIENISSVAMFATHTATTYYNATAAPASGDSFITIPQALTEFTAVAEQQRYPAIHFADPAVV